MPNKNLFILGPWARACALAGAAHAQGVATEAELAPVVITGHTGQARDGLPASLPSSTANQGRARNDPYNLDVNPGVYGGVSKVNQLDLRAAGKWSRRLEMAVGLNNATGQHAYQSHPYPGRTLSAELRFTH